MITFDDGMRSQLIAAEYMDKKNIHGVFGITTRQLETPLNNPIINDVEVIDLVMSGHVVVGHSHDHLWSGSGQPKPGRSIHPQKELVADCLKGKAKLAEVTNEPNIKSDMLILPYGTSNVLGSDHLKQLMQDFSWIRMTTGYPTGYADEPWSPAGGKRLYPHGYNKQLIGISAAADCRRPDRVIDCIQSAVKLKKMAVVCYHDVCHIHGNGQDIMWEQFTRDMGCIESLMLQDQLEIVLP